MIQDSARSGDRGGVADADRGWWRGGGVRPAYEGAALRGGGCGWLRQRMCTTHLQCCVNRKPRVYKYNNNTIHTQRRPRPRLP